jgi:hypothetical protein
MRVGEVEKATEAFGSPRNGKTCKLTPQNVKSLFQKSESTKKVQSKVKEVPFPEFK